MELIDIGVNLTHDSFAPDRAAVLLRAQRAGVRRMIVTGASAAGSLAARDLVHAHPGVLYATAGVHPHHAAEVTAAVLATLRSLLADPLVVASGECGLDYYRNFAPRAAQCAAFEAQLDLAAEGGKPVFLHQRDAHADFMAILRQHRRRLPRAVAHCFTGTASELEDYLALDLHIGITGWICDERRGLQLREIVGRIPAGRLMLETDAPYLLPRDLDPRPASRRNEPMYLPHIAAVVAACRGEPVELCAGHTTATSEAFFLGPVVR
ncbi:MAG: TatD family hydrolase [Gammaproteobacteria bacterium]|nr:TatD family hydrolase [Gammaproteobacteria bacterium]